MAAIDGAVTTDAPIITTDVAFATTEVTVNTTNAPAATTEAPIVTTDVEFAATEAPIITTDAPAATTEITVNTTDAPAATTEAPITTDSAATTTVVSTNSSAVVTESNSEEQSQQDTLSSEEEDWSQITNEEEDWSQVEPTTQNLWCGTSQFDAIRNCGTGTRCDNGVCPGSLKCFVVPSSCSSGDNAEVTVVDATDAGIASTLDAANSTLEGDDQNFTITETASTSTLTNSTEEEGWSEFINATTSTPSTLSSTDYFTTSAPATADYFINSSSIPTIQPVAYGNWSNFNDTNTGSTTSPSFPLPEDLTDTLFCGYTLDDASTACHKRCRSGSPGEWLVVFNYMITFIVK
jgi:hypothetical protein